MPTLTITLTPHLEKRLQDVAARAGQQPEEFARELLVERLDEPASVFLLPDGLPRRSTDELLALARAQGVKPVTEPEQLLGGFWPEGESVDDFLEARRQWQREGVTEQRPTPSLEPVGNQQTTP